MFRNFFLILVCLLTFKLNFAQIHADTNFPNANARIIAIDNNNVFFVPRKKNRQTANVWFYFKLYNLPDTVNIFQIVNNPLFVPVMPVFSFNNHQWHKINPQKNTGNLRKYIIPCNKNDTLYFAATYPYTYARLNFFIDSIAQISKIDTTTLCFSEKKHRVPLLIITDQTQDTISSDLIWIIARQHAFEAPANFCLEGMIDYFISDDSLAKTFRKNCIVYIVPMMDVDNVINGATGRMQKPVDFNRDWRDSSFWKAVSETKKMIETTAELHNFRIFLDIHSLYPSSIGDNITYFNIYNKNSEQYQNLQEFWNIFSSLSNQLPFEVTDLSQKPYADMYIKNNYPYTDFVSTIECPWQYDIKHKIYTPTYWRKIGKFLAQSLALYLLQNVSK